MNRLSATRAPDGYRDKDGRLVLNYATLEGKVSVTCAGCRQVKRCRWYTGHNVTIRWFCDRCVGAADRPGRPFGDEILAPPNLAKMDVLMVELRRHGHGATEPDSSS